MRGGLVPRHPCGAEPTHTMSYTEQIYEFAFEQAQELVALCRNPPPEFGSQQQHDAWSRSIEMLKIATELGMHLDEMQVGDDTADGDSDSDSDYDDDEEEYVSETDTDASDASDQESVTGYSNDDDMADVPVPSHGVEDGTRLINSAFNALRKAALWVDNHKDNKENIDPEEGPQDAEMPDLISDSDDGMEEGEVNSH